MAGDLSEPRDIYERLWREASDAFERGAPRLDPFLKNRTADRRRGLTLIATPSPAVCSRIEDFLCKLAAVAPEQHFYQPPEFHLTVFSIIPGSESWRLSFEKLPDILIVLEDVLKSRPAFSIAFRGVTASPEAVMIQGFPVGNALTELRDQIRAAFARRGLADGLDRRYKIATAHLTVARFSTPMKDWKPLQLLLAAHHETGFGVTRVDSLQLVDSDWYACAATLRTLREYPLS